MEVVVGLQMLQMPITSSAVDWIALRLDGEVEGYGLDRLPGRIENGFWGI